MKGKKPSKTKSKWTASMPFLTNLYDLIKDTTPSGYPDEVQCDYVDPQTNKQCITLLNWKSIKAKTGRCDYHRNFELREKYDWECTVKIFYQTGGRKVSKRCSATSYHRTCIDGLEVILCPKHLKEHLERGWDERD